MPERTPSDLARAEDLRLMLQSSGWQHVLGLIFQQLRHYEAYIGPGYSDAQRFDAIGRRGMLLDLIQMTYKQAETPSPLDLHYVQWLATLTPPAPVAAPTPTRDEPPLPPDPRRLRRQAGSVA